jgi:serine/threonine protein kinase
LVHRDIKPKNIAVSHQGQVKILDLGLALCKNEVLSSGRLTAQAAIGSYQYMAPEQFDDSHDVDIRADLYSLGCSFYHLLVGSPPFSGDKYRTLASLMEAHQWHSPASVLDFNGLVGPELSAIIDRLLAKEAADRIQSPEELASLLKTHAERANLPAIVAMACASTPDPVTQLPGHDPSDLSTPDASATTVTRELPARSWDHKTSISGSKRRRWTWFAGLSTAFVAVLASLFYWGHRAQEQADAQLIRRERQDVAFFLTNMPGLNGQWWIDENPWLLPSIRAELYDWVIHGDDLHPGHRIPIQLDEADIAPLRSLRKMEDMPKLQAHVQQLARQLAVHLPSGQRNAFFSIEGDDPESLDDNKIRTKFENIAQWHQTDPTNPSPIDLHVQALARHKQGRFSEAEGLYRNALDRIDQLITRDTTSQPTSSKGKANSERNQIDQGWLAIGSLLMADYGELLFSMARYDDAALQFRLASESCGDTSNEHREFLVYARSRECDSLRKNIENRSQAHDALAAAKESAKSLPPLHPLVAFVHEREAWLALDEWQADLAIHCFEIALPIRQKHLEAGNKRAPYFVYLNQQGLAMAERLQGSLQATQTRLEDLAKQVERARTEPKRLSAKQRAELENRYLNTLERMADVPLFDLNQPALACIPLEKGMEFARQESLLEGKLARRVDRIRFKLALALATSGREKEASQILPPTVRSPLLGIELQYQNLAQSAIAMAKNEPHADESLAKIALDVDADRANRDEIELALLAARLFYRTPSMNTDLGARLLRWHARLVESIGRNAENRSLLAYLRPQYDLIIQSAASLPDFPPIEIAHIALESRTPRSSTVEKDSLIFFFESDRGWIIDVDPEGSAVVIATPFGTSAIIEARNNPERRAELTRQTPESIRQRAKTLPPERLFIEDPVRGLIPNDIAPFIQE